MQAQERVRRLLCRRDRNLVRVTFIDHATAVACGVTTLDPTDYPTLWLNIRSTDGDGVLEYDGKYYGDWAVTLTKESD